MTNLKREDFHIHVTRELFRKPISDRSGLYLMAVFQLYKIQFSKGTLVDAPQQTGFDALTQRHAAEVVSAIWNGSQDERRDYMFWYGAWHSAGYHEVFSDFSAEQQQEIVRFKELIEKHPLVSGLVLED